MVSVTSTGHITLPVHFLKTHNVSNGARVHLYWDKAKEAVAVGLVSNDNVTAFPVVFPAQGTTFIKAQRFFKANRVNLEEYAGQYTYARYRAADVGITDAVTDVFVIELKRRLSRNRVRR